MSAITRGASIRRWTSSRMPASDIWRSTASWRWPVAGERWLERQIEHARDHHRVGEAGDDVQDQRAADVGHGRGGAAVVEPRGDDRLAAVAARAAERKTERAGRRGFGISRIDRTVTMT